MASGDANRTWFPEMIGILKTDWNVSMSWEEIIQFRDRLDQTLQGIRTTRNIQPAMMWCPKCQTRHRSAPPKVSVGALILALSRFKVEEEEIASFIAMGYGDEITISQIDYECLFILSTVAVIILQLIKLDFVGGSGEILLDVFLMFGGFYYLVLIYLGLGEFGGCYFYLLTELSKHKNH